MRTVRDMLRYTFEKKFSQRRIAAITGVSRKAVNRVLSQFEKHGLSWPLSDDIDDRKLDELINPKTRTHKSQGTIDFGYIDLELKKPGATIAILHEEWVNQNPEENTFQYNTYCRKYRAWKKIQKLSMRGETHYGQAVFVDYSGKTFPIHSKVTGEILKAQLFVGVLGGSNYTFAEVTWSQKKTDWIGSHVRMYEYFGGVPETVVPDNLKSAVTKTDLYDPVLNESYLQLCRHYNTVPLPARVGRPKDKPRVEAGVGLCQRWIIFKLRNRKFFSLEEANLAIRILLEELNRKEFQKISGSRFSRWLEHELPALMPLPEQPYEAAEWGKVRAGPDYLVTIDGHAYSVPYQLRGQEFDYRASNTAIELLQFDNYVVTHVRSSEKEKVTLLPEHRAPAHDAVQGWTREKALQWVADVGPTTSGHLEYLLDRGHGPLSGYRTTQAFRSLAKNYGTKRLEEVCEYALSKNLWGTKNLRNILSKKIDQLMRDEVEEIDGAPIEHDNIRGPDHYAAVLDNEQGDTQNDE